MCVTRGRTPDVCLGGQIAEEEAGPATCRGFQSGGMGIAMQQAQQRLAKQTTRKQQREPGSL
jgi:hypothetical protein